MPKEFYQTWRINSVSEYGNCMQTGTLPQHVIRLSSGSGNQCIVVLIIASLNRNQTNCNDCTPDFSIESQYHVCCIHQHTHIEHATWILQHTHSPIPLVWLKSPLTILQERPSPLQTPQRSSFAEEPMIPSQPIFWAVRKNSKTIGWWVAFFLCVWTSILMLWRHKSIHTITTTWKHFSEELRHFRCLIIRTDRTPSPGHSC